MATCKQLSCNESVENTMSLLENTTVSLFYFKELIKKHKCFISDQNNTIFFFTHSHLIMIVLSQMSSLVVPIDTADPSLLLFSPLLLPGGTISSVCLLMYSLSFFSRTRPHHFEQYRFDAPLCDVQSLTVCGVYTSSSSSLPVSSRVSQSSALYRT